MSINTTILKAVSMQALNATDNPRWHSAIIKAAAWLKDNTPRFTPDGDMIIESRSSDVGAYKVNGHCQCKASEFGQPCWHRAAARLYELTLDAQHLASRYTYQGRELLYTLTPAGEPILEDTLTGRAFSVQSIKEHGDGDALTPVVKLAKAA